MTIAPADTSSCSLLPFGQMGWQNIAVCRMALCNHSYTKKSTFYLYLTLMQHLTLDTTQVEHCIILVQLVSVGFRRLAHISRQLR